MGAQGASSPQSLVAGMLRRGPDKGSCILDPAQFQLVRPKGETGLVYELCEHEGGCKQMHKINCLLIFFVVLNTIHLKEFLKVKDYSLGTRISADKLS